MLAIAIIGLQLHVVMETQDLCTHSYAGVMNDFFNLQVSPQCLYPQIKQLDNLKTKSAIIIAAVFLEQPEPLSDIASTYFTGIVWNAYVCTGGLNHRLPLKLFHTETPLTLEHVVEQPKY